MSTTQSAGRESAVYMTTAHRMAGLPLRMFITLALVTIGASCSRGPANSKYFWAAPGVRRVYDAKVRIPFAEDLNGTAIMRHDGTVTVDGHTYHTIVTTFDLMQASDPEVNYYRLSQDGIYTRKSLDPAVPEVLDLPLPPEVGRKWSYELGNVKADCEILAVEDVDTAKRTYRQCLKVASIGTQGGDAVRTVSYYAPEIGIVKTSVEGAGMIMELRLREEER